jgi:hypothetical protein
MADDSAIRKLLTLRGVEFVQDTHSLIDCVTYKIIVEVEKGTRISEQYRMRQMYFDLGGCNLIFIRYNPDNLFYVEQLIQSFDSVKVITENIRVYCDGSRQYYELDPYILRH